MLNNNNSDLKISQGKQRKHQSVKCWLITEHKVSLVFATIQWEKNPAIFGL